MKAKTAMYAAVGAPIVAARALNTRLETLRREMESRGEGLGDRAQQLLDEWSREGRQAMGKVSEGKMVDEFASKVDFDQARQQVGKLRDQLEDVLGTWRTSFRPESSEQAPIRPEPVVAGEEISHEGERAVVDPEAHLEAQGGRADHEGASPTAPESEDQPDEFDAPEQDEEPQA